MASQVQEEQPPIVQDMPWLPIIFDVQHLTAESLCDLAALTHRLDKQIQQLNPGNSFRMWRLLDALRFIYVKKAPSADKTTYA